MVALPSVGRATGIEAPPIPAEAAATQDLYERYGRRIYGYCLHQLGSREEAEDAVQTTFLNAFRSLRRGVTPQLEAAWLFKIAANVCLSRRRSHVRRRRVETPGDIDAFQDVLPAPTGRGDELHRLEEALAAMPEQQRKAILLREWQGLSYREIAEELELSQAAVETLIFRARRSLAHGLEQPDRKGGFGRLRHGADVGSVLATLKSFLLGGSVAVKVAVAVAVATTAGVVAAKPAHHARHVRHARPSAALDRLTAAPARPARNTASAAPHARRRSSATRRRPAVRAARRSPAAAARQPSTSAARTGPTTAATPSAPERTSAKADDPAPASAVGATPAPPDQEEASPQKGPPLTAGAPAQKPHPEEPQQPDVPHGVANGNTSPNAGGNGNGNAPTTPPGQDKPKHQ